MKYLSTYRKLMNGRMQLIVQDKSGNYFLFDERRFTRMNKIKNIYENNNKLE